MHNKVICLGFLSMICKNIFIYRQQLERLPRRQAEAVAKATSYATPQPSVVMDFAGAIAGGSSSHSNSNSQFLLSR